MSPATSGEWLVPFKGRCYSGHYEQNFLWRHGNVYVMDNHRTALWCWLQHVDPRRPLVEIPTGDYPIIFNMLVYPPPDVVNVNTEPGRLVVGMKLAHLKFDQIELYRKHRISGFSSAIWDNQMLTRMLAKIAHSFAVAELGLDKFEPRLVSLITRGDISTMNLVGGDDALNDGERPSEALHELALGYQRINGTAYVVARIRLFASSGGPFYSVVVGESLETPFARLARFSKYVLRRRQSIRRIKPLVTTLRVQGWNFAETFLVVPQQIFSLVAQDTSCNPRHS